jgi:hypothetical protein
MRVRSFGSLNDIEFSGERKRVRCNEGLDARITHWKSMFTVTVRRNGTAFPLRVAGL